MYTLTDLAHMISTPVVGLRIPVGVCDATPTYRAEHWSLSLSPTQGVWMINGWHGSGRSAALETLVLSAAEHANSSHAQFIIIDSFNTLSDIQQCPNVARYTTVSSKTLIPTLEHVCNLIATRTEVISTQNCECVCDYYHDKTTHEISADPYHDVVVIIDTIGRLLEHDRSHQHHPIDADSNTHMFTSYVQPLITQGPQVGVYTVMVADLAATWMSNQGISTHIHRACANTTITMCYPYLPRTVVDSRVNKPGNAVFPWVNQEGKRVDRLGCFAFPSYQPQTGVPSRRDVRDAVREVSTRRRSSTVNSWDVCPQVRKTTSNEHETTSSVDPHPVGLAT